MVLTFTGTQRGMTDQQEARVAERLRATMPELLCHGDCIGADEQVHDLCCALGIRVSLNPCTITSKRAYCGGPVVHCRHDPLDPLVRNQRMVDRCDALLAAPAEMAEERRSGTWSTVRKARKARVPVVIVFPDGTERVETWD